MARKITKEELATYIESVFKNKKFVETMHGLPRLSSAKKMSDDISYLCTEYFLCTGDPSPEVIERICSEVSEVYSDPKNPRYKNQRFDKLSPLANDLADSAGHEIVDYWAKQLGCSNPISAEDMVKILQAASQQVSQTRFHTHSFPGVLRDKVKTEGLNINNEMFTEELKTLEGIGIRTTFKTGVLNTVELSQPSFGYCHTSPERVKLMFSPRDGVQHDNEPLDEYLKRGLKERIDAVNPSPEARKRFTEAGERIIDFYNETTSSCMAIMDMGPGHPCSLEDSQSTLYSYIYDLPSMASFSTQEKQVLAADLEAWSQIRNDKTLTQAEKYQRLCPIIDRMRTQYGEEIGKKVKKVKEFAFFKTMTISHLPNFETSNANGYDIEGGRIPPEEMAIASFQDPYKYYPGYRKFMEQKAARAASQAKAAPKPAETEAEASDN